LAQAGHSLAQQRHQALPARGIKQRPQLDQGGADGGVIGSPALAGGAAYERGRTGQLADDHLPRQAGALGRLVRQTALDRFRRQAVLLAQVTQILVTSFGVHNRSVTAAVRPDQSLPFPLVSGVFARGAAGARQGRAQRAGGRPERVAAPLIMPLGGKGRRHPATVTFFVTQRPSLR